MPQKARYTQRGTGPVVGNKINTGKAKCGICKTKYGKETGVAAGVKHAKKAGKAIANFFRGPKHRRRSKPLFSGVFAIRWSKTQGGEADAFGEAEAERENLNQLMGGSAALPTW